MFYKKRLEAIEKQIEDLKRQVQNLKAVNTNAVSAEKDRADMKQIVDEWLNGAKQ